MRFTITLPDDLTGEIDEEAARIGVSRTEWIRTTCTDALTKDAPETHPAHQEVVQELTELKARATYQDQRLADLQTDREYLRGEVARLQQTNDLLTHRLLPAPRPGALARVRGWLFGEDLQPAG